jgi:hypothetical protein
VLAALVGATAWGCAALLGANDPIEVDAGRPDGSGDAVVIGDATRPEIGPCPLCSPPAHATATCAGATCGFLCDDGYNACGGRCTKDDDPSSCGVSCTDCAPGGGTLEGVAVCDAGQCGMACDFGWTYCGEHGTCVNLTFDCKHCGSCAVHCGLYEKCENRACVPISGVDFLCN